jgi:hypothetical protein
MQPETPAQEISRIEQELEKLRERYALFHYWGGILKRLFAIALPLVAAAIVILGFIYRRQISDRFFSDPAFTGFIAGLFGLLMVLLWLAFWRRQPEKPFRWIDLASPRPEFSYPDAGSEAEMVEWQIATREKRLAELRARLR